MANMAFSPNITLILFRGKSLDWYNHFHAPTASRTFLSEPTMTDFFAQICL